MATLAMAPEKDIFHERLRTARQRCGLKQEEVAEKLGVAAVTVGFWEQGRQGPRRPHLRQLATLYGVSVDWLLGEEKRIGETPAEYVLEEAELALRAAGGELSEEELREIRDYIRFKRQQGREKR